MTKPRYINVNDLDRYTVEIGGHKYVPWVALAEVPTADIGERHGRWIDKIDYLGSKSGYKFCSQCSGWMPCSSVDYRFCPHCGARMDSGGEMHV